MSCRAVRTVIGVPSASSTASYRLKIAMPGPMIACDRSTGATGECSPSLSRVMASRASGSASLSWRTNCRREIVPASFARGRQTRMMEEARALVPMLDMPIAVPFASAKCQ